MARGTVSISRMITKPSLSFLHMPMFSHFTQSLSSCPTALSHLNSHHSLPVTSHYPTSCLGTVSIASSNSLCSLYLKRTVKNLEICHTERFIHSWHVPAFAQQYVTLFQNRNFCVVVVVRLAVYNKVIWYNSISKNKRQCTMEFLNQNFTLQLVKWYFSEAEWLSFVSRLVISG